MRACNKSSFKDAIQASAVFPNTQIFVPQCPILQSPHELIVDVLYILHQPPPPHITTFSCYVWDKVPVVIKLGVERGAEVIRHCM